MKSDKSLRTLTFLLCLIVSCVGSAADPSQLKGEREQILGKVSGNFLQLSFMLQYVTNEQCQKYAGNRHLAQKDLDDAIDQIQKLTNAKRSDVAREINLWLPNRLNAARKDIQQILNTTSEKSLEFQCGMLLGVTSVYYTNARAMWAGFFSLNETLVWHKLI